VEQKSGKGKPSKSTRSRHKKYARYKDRGMREFNAARVLRRHLAANPQDNGPKKARQLAVAALEQAEKAGAIGHWRKVIATLDGHMARNPNDVGAHAKYEAVKHMLR
jgi:hypothetical protein